MGRLFWKLFIAIFLALLSTDIIVGNIVEWEAQHAKLAITPTIVATLPTPDNHHALSSNQESARQEPDSEPFFSLSYVVFFFSIISSALFAGILSWSVSHPIKLLLEHLKSAADGDLLARVSPKITASHDEFSELGAAFDLMALRLNNMIKSQSKMLHHVSHELRSPLARIQMAVGLVMQNPKKMQSSLQRVELEAVRMERMISELLEIFRFESGMQKLQKTTVDLKALLTGIVGDVLFEKREAKLNLLLPANPVTIEGQLELLQRAFDNVIRNAVKYGPEQGQGVEPQELDEIFRPFVRGRRASQVEGHGIGLAMTKHIVEAHGGFVNATNLSPLGFMIRIHLPSKNEPATDQEAKNWM